MIRNAIIVIAIVATVFGSLGFPLYLHSCRMVTIEKEAGCPMCASKQSNIPTQHDTSDGASGCCSDTVVNQVVDAGTTYRADLPMPTFAGVATIVLLELVAPIASMPNTGAQGHSPPRLAARAQHTYLHISSFLI